MPPDRFPRPATAAVWAAVGLGLFPLLLGTPSAPAAPPPGPSGAAASAPAPSAERSPTAVDPAFLAEARRLLAAAGRRGGVAVHLGCGDGRFTAALGTTGSALVVHGLTTDPEALRRTRDHLQRLGLFGRVSADRFDGRRLPYVDGLVNLVVADDLGAVPEAEVLRVLAPGGVALVGGEKTVKPWPAGIERTPATTTPWPASAPW